MSRDFLAQMAASSRTRAQAARAACPPEEMLRRARAQSPAPPLRLIGAFSLEVAALMADTLAGMQIERGFVIHGAEGWDEPTPVGPFTVFDVRPGQVTRETRAPEDYGLRRCPPAALIGGDARHNAEALRAVLSGRAHGAQRDCLLLGAALALEVAGEVADPRAAMDRAREAIDGGAAGRVLDTLARVGRGA